MPAHWGQRARALVSLDHFKTLSSTHRPLGKQQRPAEKPFVQQRGRASAGPGAFLLTERAGLRVHRPPQSEASGTGRREEGCKDIQLSPKEHCFKILDGMEKPRQLHFFFFHCSFIYPGLKKTILKRGGLLFVSNPSSYL